MQELICIFLCQVADNMSSEKEVVTTFDQQVLNTLVQQDLSYVAPCSHEEADTRILLHAIYVHQKGETLLERRDRSSISSITLQNNF